MEIRTPRLSAKKLKDISKVTLQTSAVSSGDELASQDWYALRIMACGDVDDGKSTLLGRLLLDTSSVANDQLLQLRLDSQHYGRASDFIDLSLLLDGLESERTRAVTIDVAYRQFCWRNRRFLVADCPGHAEYIRNMVGGASNADVCLLLVDVRRGLSEQARLHLQVTKFFAVPRVIIAINKMDLVRYEESSYYAAVLPVVEFLSSLGIEQVSSVPVVALSGENLVERSSRMGWYTGSTIIDLLHDTPRAVRNILNSTILPIQWINSGAESFRGFAGPLLSGSLFPGKEVSLLPAGHKTTIKEVVAAAGSVPGVGGNSFTVTLVDSVEVRRGDVIVDDGEAVAISRNLLADVIWLSSESFIPGKKYLLKSGFGLSRISCLSVISRITAHSPPENSGVELGVNNMAHCKISILDNLVMTSYEECQFLGGFIIIDSSSCDTVAVGVVSRNGLDQKCELGHIAPPPSRKGKVIWLTGLSGSGKSTIANELRRVLSINGVNAIHIDGDDVRSGLSSDLGFSDTDRAENVRRVACVAKMMADAGLIVLVSLISPRRDDRLSARVFVGSRRFFEVFVDAPIEVAESRDVKGLYAGARSGEILMFTGIDAPYEAPNEPDLHLQTNLCTVDQAAAAIIEEFELLDLSHWERPEKFQSAAGKV